MDERRKREENWWEVREQPFRSDKPFIGPLIVRVRSLWNSVATKWYVRPLIRQQNAINRRLVEINRQLREELQVAQEIIVALDRELAELRQLQARTLYRSWEEADQQQPPSEVPEEGSAGQEEDRERG
ncbi:MAG: hypothetical protein D6759_15600 [Chloroflexi bacterium]|nr:MAG: hypothetical protein D6759_15600 [Chloroflexota bacterium]